MIDQLHIHNVALISDVTMRFEKGLCILTGETGSGKSIIIESIGFVLGERPSKDFLKSGETSGYVEAMFMLRNAEIAAVIRSLGVDVGDDDLLFLYRGINDTGKTQCKANGKQIPVSMLKEISSLLVDLHGQHEHQSLLKVSKHIELLDRFTNIEAERNELAEEIKAHKLILRRLKQVNEDISGANALETLTAEAEEIKHAKISRGEEDMLAEKSRVLGSADKLQKQSNDVLMRLSDNEDTNIIDLLSKAVTITSEIAKTDGSMEAIYDRLKEAFNIVTDTVSELRRYADSLNADGEELQRTEERLELLHRLKRRYNTDADGILAHYERLTKRIADYEQAQTRLKALQKEKRESAARMMAISSAMTKKRREQADVLQSQIEEVLKDLGMKSAQFEISLRQTHTVSVNGSDEVEFMISANAGEPKKPLASIASGGEMSRVMLALKAVTAHMDNIETFIFDEIDTGVSGRTAQQVAEKLIMIARSRQILCITHLPQIAAMADAHYLIEKLTDGERTETTVRRLDESEMTGELSRLIGGAKITDATTEAAEEMKRLAAEVKDRK